MNGNWTDRMCLVGSEPRLVCRFVGGAVGIEIVIVIVTRFVNGER